MIKKFLILFLILINPCYAGEQVRREQFYLNPSFNNLVSLLEVLPNTQNIDEEKIWQIFVTIALNKNPNLQQEAKANFAKYAYNIRKFLLIGLLNNQAKDIDNLKQYTQVAPSITLEEIEQINLNPNPLSQEQMYNNNFYAECLWTSFYASGDDKYLGKLLNYLAASPVIIKNLAYEMINRDQTAYIRAQQNIRSNYLQSILSSVLNGISYYNENYNSYDDLIQEAEKNNYSKYSLFSYKTILFSMILRRNNYPELNAKITALIASKPGLNYSLQ